MNFGSLICFISVKQNVANRTSDLLLNHVTVFQAIYNPPGNLCRVILVSGTLEKHTRRSKINLYAVASPTSPPQNCARRLFVTWKINADFDLLITRMALIISTNYTGYNSENSATNIRKRSRWKLVVNRFLTRFWKAVVVDIIQKLIS